jgi:hypothetical protein
MKHETISWHGIFNLWHHVGTQKFSDFGAFEVSDF